MRAFEILVVAAGALLCGCVTYHPNPLDPGAVTRAIETRSLDDPGLLAFIRAAQPAVAEAAAPRWDLTRLTLAAVYFHPNLDIARSKLRQAQGAEVTGHQIPNPSLNFEDLSVGPALSGPAYTVGPVINFIIETGGRRTYRTTEERCLWRRRRRSAPHCWSGDSLFRMRS
jgi:outer membrane protein, heavy metal efflux system